MSPMEPKNVVISSSVVMVDGKRYGLAVPIGSASHPVEIVINDSGELRLLAQMLNELAAARDQALLGCVDTEVRA